MRIERTDYHSQFDRNDRLRDQITDRLLRGRFVDYRSFCDQSSRNDQTFLTK